MQTALVQVRIDEELKTETSKIFDSLGIDMPTAIRIFLKKCQMENGLPFDMKIETTPTLLQGKNAFELLRQQAQANNLYDMSPEEVNAEIYNYRAGKKI